MRILIVAATEAEIATIRQSVFEASRFTNLDLDFLITGVGMPLTVLHMCSHLSQQGPYSLLLNLGIAGAYSIDKLPIGRVCEVVTDRMGDLGAELPDGQLMDWVEMGFTQGAEGLFESNGTLINPSPISHLDQVTGCTVNTVHGSQSSVERTWKKYQPDTESMEGAAFAMTAKHFRLPYGQIRAISNKVEVRNRDNWNIPLALKNLHTEVVSLLTRLNEVKH